MAVELLVNPRAYLGEGPVWDEQAQLLYWLDIANGLIFGYDPATGRNQSYAVGQPVGALALRRSEGLLLALRDGFAFFDLAIGQLTPIADPESHLPDNRFNDGKVDPAGRFWAGTLANDFRPAAGSLYRLDPDLGWRQMLTGLSLSNGLAWSLDHKTLYFTDTTPATITAYEYDLLSGEIGSGRVIIRVPSQMGGPDGLTIDSDGQLWIAHYGGHCVRRWNPETAEVLETIPLPVSQVTSCTFGGPQLDTLFITTATERMSEADKAREPMAGGLFAIRLPYRGLPTNRFNG